MKKKVKLKICIVCLGLNHSSHPVTITDHNTREVLELTLASCKDVPPHSDLVFVLMFF